MSGYNNIFGSKCSDLVALVSIVYAVFPVLHVNILQYRGKLARLAKRVYRIVAPCKEIGGWIIAAVVAPRCIGGVA